MFTETNWGDYEYKIVIVDSHVKNLRSKRRLR